MSGVSLPVVFDSQNRLLNLPLLNLMPPCSSSRLSPSWSPRHSTLVLPTRTMATARHSNLSMLCSLADNQV
jgi:hypothetical protein